MTRGCGRCTSLVAEPALQITDLSAGYGSSQVLFGVDLMVPPRGAVAVLGRNGAGKTTLLNAAMGLLPLLGGSVTVEGDDVTDLSTEARIRRGVGYVPQEQAIFAGLTVMDNLRVGLLSASQSSGSALDSVLELFPRLGERLRQPAGTLSGGERKMLAISRALLGKPRLLILDEPSEGVWRGLVEEIRERLVEYARGASILIVEQDLHFALGLADRAYVLDKGTFVLEGDSQQVREDPKLYFYLAP